jgi:uracil-DNA glycosylase
MSIAHQGHHDNAQSRFMPEKAKTTAAEFLPDRLNLAALRRAAVHCEGCELYQNATQTVFGEGPRRARIMLVGETPGDREDVEGHPFVGPAGVLLDQALADAGLVRDDVYVTNVVKHFRWEPRGKRRLHKKPGAGHIEACKPWLQAEILVVNPAVIVCLGATAAQALLGHTFRITRQRGKLIKNTGGPSFLATYHPSAVLRSPDEADRRRMRKEFTDDLRIAARMLSSLKSPAPRKPR